MKLEDIARRLSERLEKFEFEGPVYRRYNPLRYAWETHREYLRRYGNAPKEVVLMGINPGPWGMAQTGVPFGLVPVVRDWLQIEGRVGTPEKLHPKRPVDGFDCSRSEGSGKRLWGWAKERFKTPESFFKRFYVFNYCPLIFFDRDGRNLLPHALAAKDRERVLSVCDQALLETIELLSPRFAIGIGGFAHKRFKISLADREASITIGCIDHPSPANPRANQGWMKLAEGQLRQIGVMLPGR